MKKIALCIGNNEYSIMPELNYAVADASAIEKKLRELGFDTILKINLDREELATAIYSFIDKIEKYDAILVYYAGHGFQIEGDNILAPVDLDAYATPKMVKFNSFLVADLMKCLNSYPEKTKIIILDACRGDLNSRGVYTDFAPISAPQGSIIAFSTSPGQSSREYTNREHGIYTSILLEYLGLPRVQIETVFKKVREVMIAETGGIQIPWEHTSLIGNFYLNSDTIYDGPVYSDEALADKEYKIFKDISISNIVMNLKTHNWDYQGVGINYIYSIDYANASRNDLFVLGRNIYQAASGSCYAAQRFIDYFPQNKEIDSQAKMHILNGMLYEIYFDSNNNMREYFKLGYYERIISYAEREEFYACKEFISSKLYKEDGRVLYIPGQNEIMEFIVNVEKKDEKIYVNDVIYKGKSVLKNIEISHRAFMDLYFQCKICDFEKSVANAVCALHDYVKFKYVDYEVEKNDYIYLLQVID